MNIPGFALSALTGAFAISAYQTAPTRLTKDLTFPGKSPLTVAKTALARGAGSECQWGCDDHTNETCYPVWVITPGGQTIDHLAKWQWFPHYECRFAWGADNCQPLGPALCYRINSYDAFLAGGCNNQPYAYEDTFTTFCAHQDPPGGGGDQ